MTINKLLLKARELYEREAIEDAMKVLAELKSSAKTPMGTDFLRAKCFLKRGKEYEGTARECLKEELRLHPQNAEAESFYNNLFPTVNLDSYSDSPEFQEIAAKLSFYTMMPMRHLLNLFETAKSVLKEKVPGNFVECGVAAGGSSALLGALIGKYDSKERHCYSFDTFSGMPDPTSEDRVNGQDAQSSCWGKGTCAAPLESLREACKKVDAQSFVSPVKGLFQDTLASHRREIGEIAFLHIDCDWYESTICVLENLFPLLTPGAKVILDDYDYWDGVQQAYSEYCCLHDLHYPLVKLSPTTALITKK
jgi:hypothetical protein